MTDAAPREGWYAITSDAGLVEAAFRFSDGWAVPWHEGVLVDMPLGWTLGPRIDDLLAYWREGHGAPCHRCGKPCDSLASNPSLWPTMVPSEQSARPMHMGCLAGLLRDAAILRYLRAIADGPLDMAVPANEVAAMLQAAIELADRAAGGSRK